MSLYHAKWVPVTGQWLFWRSYSKSRVDFLKLQWKKKQFRPPEYCVPAASGTWCSSSIWNSISIRHSALGLYIMTTFFVPLPSGKQCPFRMESSLVCKSFSGQSCFSTCLTASMKANLTLSAEYVGDFNISLWLWHSNTVKYQCELSSKILFWLFG